MNTMDDLRTRIFYTPYAMSEEIVKRTWRERLFSWPWKPWNKTKKIRVPAMYSGPGNQIIAHESFRETIEKQMAVADDLLNGRSYKFRGTAQDYFRMVKGEWK